MAEQRNRRRTTGRRTALVVLTAAGWLVASAPLASAAPPDHAPAAGKHAEEDGMSLHGASSTPERGKRADAPGQATTPGRSKDAPGRATPPEPPPPAEPAPRPSPEPGSGARREATRRPAPAPAAPPPPSDRPAPPAPSREPSPEVTSRPVAATSSAAPAAEPAPASPPADPWSAFDLLRSAISAARDSADAVGADVAGSIGTATADAARRLTLGFSATEPSPARDLGVPMGVLALLGAYLAGSRWLDRGGLPMAVAEGQGDDVQHVL